MPSVVVVRQLLAACAVTGLVAGEAAAMSWTFRCSDDLNVEKDGGTALRLQSEMLVQLTSRDGRLTVDVRGDLPPGGGSAQERGQVRLTIGAGQPLTYPVPTLRIVIDQSDGRRIPMEPSGLPPALAGELAGMLSQGPAANVLKSGTEQSYAVRALIDGVESSFPGMQRNGKLWAEVSLGDGGEVSIGGREWQLPMSYEIPRRQVSGGLEFEGLTSLRYASVRPGPEEKVQVRVGLRAPGWRIERSWVAEPLSRDLPAMPVPAQFGAELPLTSSGSWTRFGPLALLGVQRLPGLSETGLAVWGAAVAGERALVAHPDQAVLIAAATTPKPSLAAPPPGQVPRSEFDRVAAERDLLRASDDGRWLVEADAAAVAAQASATTGGGGSDPSGMQFVPTLDVRLGFGDRLRWGLGSYALRLSVSSDDSALTWGEGGGGAWLGWRGDDWSASLLAGVALDSYVVRTPLYSSSQTATSPTVVASGEWRFAQDWSAALKVQATAGSDGDATVVLPAVRWWIRPALAFQAQGAFIEAGTTTDAGTDASASAYGIGIGVVLRR